MALSAAVAAEPESDAAAPPDAIALTEYMVLPAVGQYGRLPLHRDALEAQLVAGTWKLPADGDAVETPDHATGGARRRETWRTVNVDDDGTLDVQEFHGGYALSTFDSPTERVMLLEATGHAMVYVNGEPRAGDPYSLGWLRLPVLVRRGQNTLLFHLAADKLHARLMTPPAKFFLIEEDLTLPTLVRGEAETEWAWGAVPIVNATNEWSPDYTTITCGPKEFITDVEPIPPLSAYKVPFKLPKSAATAGDEAEFEFHFKRGAVGEGPGAKDETLIKTSLTLKQVDDHAIHVRTFRSRIDGSVQPYAVLPAAEPKPGEDGPDPTTGRNGMIVTLHAAGTSCEDHVAQYAAKPWATMVAPQGRRPYGFDWESLGRIDAIEALLDAQDIYLGDKLRVYLTGHSMGGHGAWHLGVTYPARFAAVAPIAGWISHSSYGGGMPSMETASEIESLLLRGYSASDTLELLSNLADTGVYVLHGAADQTVPVAQARFMRTRLAAFHPNFAYCEEPGADHWWGNECCDCPPMMEFFRHQTIPPADEVAVVNFTTANPAVSAGCHWVHIEAQEKQLSPSHVAIRQNVEARTFVGNTSNVARLVINVEHLEPRQPIDVTLDGQDMHWLGWPEETHELWFERAGEKWTATEPSSRQLKGPARNGTFSAVFTGNPYLVYGTAGTEEENRWAAAKARYDAETFYYRGNGALDVLPDTRFDLNEDTDRSVVLYGNADTNRAWPLLLSTSPVEVRRGKVRVGTRTESGNDVAVVTVRPRPGSDVAMVGVVAGTGAAGMRLTDRLRWFVSGIVYPDLMVLGPNVVSTGTADVRAWGYFGLDWQVESGEIAWRDAAL